MNDLDTNSWQLKWSFICLNQAEDLGWGSEGHPPLYPVACPFLGGMYTAQHEQSKRKKQLNKHSRILVIPHIYFIMTKALFVDAFKCVSFPLSILFKYFIHFMKIVSVIK